MGQAFLYGTGGGGTGGTLTVTAPAGVTCTVSKDGKTKTRPVDSSGVATFKGLDTGTWTVTISDGSQTSTAYTVEIVADYAVTVSFFSATIAVTYPEGSICTCSDGSTTMTAPTTSGSYTFTVGNAGDWTVSCTDGEDTNSTTVTITTDGESQSVTLYRYFYKSGESTSIAGDWYWTYRGGCSGYVFDDGEGFGLNAAGNGYVQAARSAGNAIDVTNLKTIYATFINVTSVPTEYPSQYGHAVGLRSTKVVSGDFSSASASFEEAKGILLYALFYDIVYSQSAVATQSITLEIDVSNLSGEKYLSIWFGCLYAKCTEVYAI